MHEAVIERIAAYEALNYQNHGVVIIGPDREIVFMNDAAEALISNSQLLNLQAGSLRCVPPDMENWLAGRLRLTFSDQLKSNGKFSEGLWAFDQGRRLHLLTRRISIATAEGIKHLCSIFISYARSEIEHITENLCSIYELSARESEVAGLIIQGKSVKEIAGLFDLQESTIRTHIKRIYLKTELSNLSGIVRLGLSLNIRNQRIY